MTTPEPRNKGGRPTRAALEARDLSDLRDVDRLIMRQSLALIRNPKTSPAVRLQALQTLDRVKDRLPKQGGAEATPASGPGWAGADETLLELSRRAREIEQHFGRPLVELLPSLSETGLPG